MDVCGVPDLLNILTKIVRERQDYCYLCLRTEDERRLVAPKHFKQFMSVMKLPFNEPPILICYMCEHQSATAMKLFQATAFAASLSRIIRELRTKYVMSHVMVDSKFFRKIVTNLGLSPNLTPAVVDEEVQNIRKNGLLTETDTLVMDNQEVYDTTATPTVVALTTGPSHNDCTTQIQRRCTTPDELIVPDNNNKSQQANAPFIILDDDDDPIRCPPPLTQVNSTTWLNVTTRFDAPVPLNSTTPLNSTGLSNSSVQSNSTVSLNSSAKSYLTPKKIAPKIQKKNLVVTSNPPNLISVHDFISQPMKEKANVLLHPIFLQDGRLHVPSLSAVIMNGMLVFFKPATNAITASQPLGVNEDIIKENLMSNNEVFIQNSPNFVKQNPIPQVNQNPANTNQLPQNVLNSNSNLIVNSQTVDGQNMLTLMPQIPNEPEQKKKKIDDGILNSAIDNIGAKRRSSNVNVTISDISSDLDDVDNRVINRRNNRVNKSEHKTDWEDKIPMDVISFMDAVDPNAHSVLKTIGPDGCSTMQLSEVRSLNNDCDVIDLC